ncbi:MAG: Lipid-A-disaccharide synthase [Chlamydiae bacterium]|nr:Lipid-A-disaccharide synthase [Chlamydiota bacterium]
MISEHLRSFLYPFGLLANLLFGLRFLVQWLQSEKAKKSVVPKSFWALSLVGNVIFALHAAIQLQYPLCVLQVLNGIIAWRNLNLSSSSPYSLKTTLLVMGGFFLLVTTYFFSQPFSWMTPPTLPWNGTQAIHATFLWHLLGFIGMVLFASRFWIQWWSAEKAEKSTLDKSFWWMSLIGGGISLLYFIRLLDPVNILGYGVGLFPYIRNLMLLNRSPTSSQKQQEGYFLIAGEQSGDLLGGKLVEALRRKIPQIPLEGVGGAQMKDAGMEIIHPMERFQVMGFWDVFRALPKLLCDFRKLTQRILQEQPEGVIFIDYPDFNMLLARRLRKKGYKGKLIHYVCPSVWAWRKKRVHSLAKTLDLLLAILPFEKECFSETKLPVSYVGHPLVATLESHSYMNTPKTSKPILALFPGSRTGEINRNLPLQWKVAQAFSNRYTIAVSVARSAVEEEIRKHLPEEILLVPGESRYELMKEAKLALATSGTVVLELGLHSVPTVVTYQLPLLNYLLGRYLFRILLTSYTLVNLICEKTVFPEFIHRKIDPKEVILALQSFENDSTLVEQECARLRALLQTHDASEKAATDILGIAHGPDVSLS